MTTAFLQSIGFVRKSASRRVQGRRITADVGLRKPDTSRTKLALPRCTERLCEPFESLALSRVEESGFWSSE